MCTQILLSPARPQLLGYFLHLLCPGSAWRGDLLQGGGGHRQGSLRHGRRVHPPLGLLTPRCELWWAGQWAWSHVTAAETSVETGQGTLCLRCCQCPHWDPWLAPGQAGLHASCRSQSGSHTASTHRTAQASTAARAGGWGQNKLILLNLLLLGLIVLTSSLRSGSKVSLA